MGEEGGYNIPFRVRQLIIIHIYFLWCLSTTGAVDAVVAATRSITVSSLRVASQETW